MITKTMNLDGAYQEVFDEIREKSHGALDINNIEGYFGNLLEITALDKKYLRLPVDEPLFAIDANSRKIDIPSEFKSNGLSVQGDHLAETVFFSIDRYFDYMDLSTCDISINWKMGTETGKTQNFIMSTDIIPGAIVFGWPVNNTITVKSGSLQFAVEFSKKDDGNNLLYAFNTLAANINIKDGLIIDKAKVVSLEDDILSILTNSQFGEGDAAVGDVHWFTGNGHGLVIGTGPDTAVVLGEYADTINLETVLNEGIPESIPVNLYAEAFVDPGTEIKYMNSLGGNLDPVMSKVNRFAPVEDLDNLDAEETYYDAEGNVVEGEDLENATELFIAAPLNEELKYYVAIADSDPVAYRLANDAELADESVELYVKLAKLVVSEAGSYIVKAQGQKFDTNGNKIGVGAAVTCDPITVPQVEVPSAINIEKSDAPIAEDTNYSFNTEESANVVFLGENGGTLTASAVLDSFGAVQFVWQKKIGDATTFSNVAEEDVPFVLENSSVLNIEDEGEYQVIVKNFKNGGESIAVKSEVVTASELAGKIVSAATQYKKGNNNFVDAPAIVDFNSSILSQNLSLTIANVEIDGKQGNFEYEWYKSASASGEDKVLVSTNAVFEVGAGDFYYFPVIKNNYRGSIYTYQLPAILANDE